MISFISNSNVIDAGFGSLVVLKRMKSPILGQN